MPSHSKSYYNQPDLSGETPVVVHKPNEISASDLAPPPPYSPASSSAKNTTQYDAVRDSVDQPEEQVGLLSQQQTFPSRDVKPISRSTNAHLELPINEGSSSSPITRQRRGRDPGCCRRWCKYMFLVIILSLVLYKISDKLTLSDPLFACPNGMTWQSMPSTIDFAQNIELVMEGSVTQSIVTVVPLDDRHGGSLVSAIQVSPPHLQDEMTYTIEQPQDNTVRVHIQFPTVLQTDDCVRAHIEVRVPYAADMVRIHATHADVMVHPFVKDIRTLDIKTSSGDLVVDQWAGESARLATTQGELRTGPLRAKDRVYLENSNGAITATDQVVAKRSVIIKNSNGDVVLLGKVQADDSIHVESDNALMQLSELLADRVFVQNANEKIQLDAVVAKEQITVKTSNAPIDVSVVGEKDNRVAIITSNANVNLHMTHEFEGRFSFGTSQGSIEVSDDENEIRYQDKLSYLKRGYRKRAGDGDLSIQTSNANIQVSFNF